MLQPMIAEGVKSGNLGACSPQRLKPVLHVWIDGTAEAVPLRGFARSLRSEFRWPGWLKPWPSIGWRAVGWQGQYRGLSTTLRSGRDDEWWLEKDIPSRALF